MSICTNLCVCVCACVCVCVCIYIYIYIYMHFIKFHKEGSSCLYHDQTSTNVNNEIPPTKLAAY